MPEIFLLDFNLHTVAQNWRHDCDYDYPDTIFSLLYKVVQIIRQICFSLANSKHIHSRTIVAIISQINIIITKMNMMKAAFCLMITVCYCSSPFINHQASLIDHPCSIVDHQPTPSTITINHYRR